MRPCQAVAANVGHCLGFCSYSQHILHVCDNRTPAQPWQQMIVIVGVIMGAWFLYVWLHSCSWPAGAANDGHDVCNCACLDPPWFNGFTLLPKPGDNELFLLGSLLLCGPRNIVNKCCHGWTRVRISPKAQWTHTNNDPNNYRHLLPRLGRGASITNVQNVL